VQGVVAGSGKYAAIPLTRVPVEEVLVFGFSPKERSRGMEEIVAKIQVWVAAFGINMLTAILIVVVGRWVARFIRNTTGKLMASSKVDATLVTFVGHLIYFSLLTFVILAALAQLGIQTTSFIAVIGAAGLAVGLALQGSLANFAAGVLMVIFRPFQVGDFIEGAGVSGIVEEMQIFTTQLRTPDNKTIIIPNAKITGDNVTNYTRKDKRRVDLVIGVSYRDEIGKVKGVVADVLNGDERVLKDPAPTIAVLELGDSSVNFAVRPWVRTEDYWDVYFETTEKIKKRFDAEGISIPFPQRDVHLYQA
jgi:small conductance mechanosensitive channel